MAHYDVAILGGGPGGYLAAERLAEAHLRVALIEKGDIGGTCLNIGCIPTKTLLNSAKLYTHAKESSPFGIETEGVRVNWQRTLEWKNEVVTRLRRSLELTLKKAEVEIVRGSGMLTGAKTIEVRPETKSQEALSESAGTASADLAPTGPLQLEADQIIIATGSSPILPPIPGTVGNPAIKDSTGLLSLSEIPQKLCIIGGGVIGVEFASLFSALGSRVTVIEMMDEIVPAMDPQMAMMLRNALKQVTFLRSTKVTAVNGNKVEYQTKTGEQGSVEADIVLMSVGRKANIEGWGAPEAGLEIKNRSIATDEHMRTNLPGVWAIGDVTGKSQLAHAAYRMAEVAVADILARRTGQHGPQIFVPETVPWALYSMPEAAGVGYTESEAKAKGYEIEVIRSPYGVSGRFIAENGFSAPGSIKIIMEKDSQRLLGIHLLGPYASEHIWGLALALERRLPLSALQNMVFPHPTVSEVIREAAWNAHK
jgi:dihydrolipoamide dehydrogenase